MKYFNNWHEKRREWIVDEPLTPKGGQGKISKIRNTANHSNRFYEK